MLFVTIEQAIDSALRNLPKTTSDKTLCDSLDDSGIAPMSVTARADSARLGSSRGVLHSTQRKTESMGKPKRESVAGTLSRLQNLVQRFDHLCKNSHVPVAEAMLSRVNACAQAIGIQLTNCFREAQGELSAAVQRLSGHRRRYGGARVLPARLEKRDNGRVIKRVPKRKKRG